MGIIFASSYIFNLPRNNFNTNRSPRINSTTSEECIAVGGVGKFNCQASEASISILGGIVGIYILVIAFSVTTGIVSIVRKLEQRARRPIYRRFSNPTDIPRIPHYVSNQSAV